MGGDEFFSGFEITLYFYDEISWLMASLELVGGKVSSCDSLKCFLSCDEC